MKIPKQRIIYNNYDLSETYPDDELKAIAVELEWISEDEVDDVSEERLWQWRYEESETDWDNAKYELKKFFDGKTVGIFGSVGLWYGVRKIGEIGEFWELFNKAITDCDYIKLYDENGHFHLTCSHHDGTNSFEFKVITDVGRDYLERWENNWDDKRNTSDVFSQLSTRYSRLPRFMEKVYGCPAIENIKPTKADLIDKLKNEAKSFYS